jgi:aminoglycoside phosphotransferase (APT) family kinase protein
MAAITIGEKSGWAEAGRNIPIDIGEVACLLEPWRDARPVASATFLAGGLMNRNYKVRVGTDDVVLRFYDRDVRACGKEVAILSDLAGRVPTPDVLYVAPVTETVPFVVLEFVEGISMRDLKQSGDLKAIGEAAYGAGRELATLASVRLSEKALTAIGLEADDELLRGTHVNARLIDHFLASDPVRKRLGDVASRVHDFAWRHDDALSATRSASGIAHGDFNAANILVRRVDDRWTIVAILDWEFAFAGSIAYDIGNFLRYERASNPRFEPWFSRGLFDGGVDLSGDWRTIARAADLSALCELLTRPAMPGAVVDEIRDLITATLDGLEQSSS